jgi:hypothetical protein
VELDESILGTLPDKDEIARAVDSAKSASSMSSSDEKIEEKE